jgi:hypothetical protein
MQAQEENIQQLTEMEKFAELKKEFGEKGLLEVTEHRKRV